MGVGLAELGIRLTETGCVAHNFFLNPAGFVNAFVFEVKDRINAVLAFQRPETALEPPAGEDGAVSSSRLSLQIKFCGPSAGYSVFQFCVGRDVEALT